MLRRPTIARYPWMSVDLVTNTIEKRGLNSNPSRAPGHVTVSKTGKVNFAEAFAEYSVPLNIENVGSISVDGVTRQNDARLKMELPEVTE